MGRSYARASSSKPRWFRRTGFPRMTAGLTYAGPNIPPSNLVGNDSGAPLDPRAAPASRVTTCQTPELVATGGVTWTPEIGSGGLTGLVYIDGRMTSDYNTSSDLFRKEQDGAIFNARVGVRGPDEWASNSGRRICSTMSRKSHSIRPSGEEGATTSAFADPQYPDGRQIFSQFLTAEPRTYGVTLRGEF